MGRDNLKLWNYGKDKGIMAQMGQNKSVVQKKM
jgi:hypothetical protein